MSIVVDKNLNGVFQIVGGGPLAGTLGWELRWGFKILSLVFPGCAACAATLGWITALP